MILKKCAKNAHFSLSRQVPYKIGIAKIYLDFCKNVFFITKYVIFVENFVYYSMQLVIFYEKQQNSHTIPFH